MSGRASQARTIENIAGRIRKTPACSPRRFGRPCRAATADLAWLLTRGYPRNGSLKLVGDRHGLLAGSGLRWPAAPVAIRKPVGDAAARRSRAASRSTAVAGRLQRVDDHRGWLAGGVLLAGRDGAYRDMASMHGSYRKVAETRPALELIGRVAADLGVSECRVFSTGRYPTAAA